MYVALQGYDFARIQVNPTASEPEVAMKKHASYFPKDGFKRTPSTSGLQSGLVLQID